MKSNPLVKFLVIPFAILALFMVVKLFSKDSSEKQTQAPETLVLSTGEAKKLGVDGDTPGDTLRTIVVESRQLKDQVSNALKNNDELKQQNQELQRRLQSINDNVDSKLQNVQSAGEVKAFQSLAQAVRSEPIHAACVPVLPPSGAVSHHCSALVVGVVGI